MHVGQGCLLGSVQGFTSRLELSMIQTLSRSWKDNNDRARRRVHYLLWPNRIVALRTMGLVDAMHFVGPSSRVSGVYNFFVLVEPRKQALRIGKGP